jgi:toxin YoeB
MAERQAVFQREFVEDLESWAEEDRAVARRVLVLVEAALADPASGPGRPRALGDLAAGVFSRRITQEHRLVYLARRDRVDFLQARYRY